MTTIHFFTDTNQRNLYAIEAGEQPRLQYFTNGVSHFKNNTSLRNQFLTTSPRYVKILKKRIPGRPKVNNGRGLEDYLDREIVQSFPSTWDNYLQVWQNPNSSPECKNSGLTKFVVDTIKNDPRKIGLPGRRIFVSTILPLVCMRKAIMSRF